MISVGKYFVAYLSLWMVGCSFFMIFATVMWFLSVSSTVMPRSLELGFWVICVVLMFN